MLIHFKYPSASNYLIFHGTTVISGLAGTYCRYWFEAIKWIRRQRN
ncbi:hypothetical protein IDJ75_14830 [Mucilaginibacter rigui]|uniref:Uncharacterized protein n=1 Tax=Mucilaginibacter rigui TaxID=534635 RepID=A0ABR7X7K6_9SPHI|nr:hypothetical protein [Mucilaginibacter rigui]MBD1386559.1 hypothetical protein [Mucilaginibacter rigui]